MMSTTTQRPYRMHAGERHPCWLPQATKSVAQVLHRTHRSSLDLQTAQPQVCVRGAWLDAGPLHVSVYQRRARIVRAKRVRTRPFVGSSASRPASGPSRSRYDGNMMKCPPVKGLPRRIVDPWNVSGPAVVWPRNPRCSEALLVRNEGEHHSAPSAVRRPCIAMLPARQQCPASMAEDGQ
jgi:hypothetical protein